MPRIQPTQIPGRSPSRLDDGAIDRLVVLLEDTLPHGGLPLEGVDGLFSAALVSPGSALELNDLLPVALGQQADARPDELNRLLTLMWDVIRTRIARHPEGDITELLPLIEFPAENKAAEIETGDGSDEFPVGATWALGFILGYGLRRSEWEQRLDADEELAWQVMDIFALATPILDEVEQIDDLAEDTVLVESGTGQAHAVDVSELFAFDTDVESGDEHSFDDAWEETDEEEPISLEERFDIIADLPGTLHELHLVAVEERTLKQALPPDQAPGRNDPCPCGSGRKFKACHGNPSRLH